MKSPRELNLPYDSWRPGQRLALRTAFHAKTMHTVIQAPTGSGKSLIAAGLTKLDDRRSIALTATKGLEDQYSGTFPHFYDVRGMSNYECLAARDQFRMWFRLKRKHDVTCDDGPCRSGQVCELQQDGCLYFDAVRAAMGSKAVLTNYAYYLAMRRYARGLGVAERLILDEAHDLPEQLMAAFRIEMPFSLEPPQLPYPDDKSLDRVPALITEWKAWASAKLEDLFPKGGSSEDIRHRRQRQVDSLSHLLQIDDTWAWDVGAYGVTFEPTIPKLLMPLLVDKGTAPRLVYLSATVTPAMLSLLDIDPADITFHVMKSRFAVERRPVYLVDSVRVDHKMTGDMVTYWLSRIDKIIGKRLDRKGIIHTVSYQRQQWLLAHSKYRGIMIAPARASELAAAVARFKSSPAPSLLVSPSVTTGWDFPGATAEYQIIVKLPFPDTRSAIARARIRATPGYRDHLTAQHLVQAAGRIVRSEEDQGETFIVDDHFVWAQKKLAPLFPEWFREGISKARSLPSPPAPLPRVRSGNGENDE